MSISSSSWCCCSWWKPSSMVSATLDQRPSSHPVEQVAHPVVDVAAVDADVVGAGPADHAALGAA